MKLNLYPGLLPGRKKARIEMLPLIDIVAVHRGLPVVLPVSSTAEIDTELTLTLTVNDDGSAYLDKESIAIEDLKTVLLGRIGAMKESETADAKVLLFADRSLSYQDLYKVLDQIKMAGIANISLQADGPQ
jgi:biopolymer transport protein ExbD